MQTELVRHGVDARVVRVDESLALFDAAHGVLDQRGVRVPADEPRPAQVGLGEATVPELRTRDDRNRAPEERGVALHVERIGRPRTGIHRPPQHVEHVLAPTSIRYPTMPCCAGARPVAIDVSAVAVVAGRTVVIGPPSMPRASACAAVLLDRVPPETVEDQQHDLLCVAHDRREPGCVAGAEQRRHEARDRRAVERRDDRTRQT